MADSEQFDAFYLASRDRLALQVAALTGDRTEALDHVQEAFIRAWTRWDRVGGYDDPEAWVRRVAVNLATSRWRRARRMVLHPNAGADQVHLDAAQETVIDALAILPLRERQAVVLHHLLGFSVADIATELNSPTGTVKSWLSRGRAKLAHQLETERDAERDAGRLETERDAERDAGRLETEKEVPTHDR